VRQFVWAGWPARKRWEKDDFRSSCRCIEGWP
jgi:hypothetical protein